MLFTVPFCSEMTDADIARLQRSLDLWTHMAQKMHPSPNSPGLARLDHFSGLFLERGHSDGQWELEARTWGTPAPATAHEWHLVAANAARQLDRSVELPKRLSHATTDPDRPARKGRNRHRAVAWRRLVRLA